jgi:hypothetical protein
MNPKVTKKQIIDYLKSKKLGVEIFDEYPTDKTNVRHGIYVSNPMVQSTTVFLQSTCGSMYEIKEEVDVLFVSIQDDLRLEPAADAITDIPISTIADSFVDIIFTTDREYLNRAEYRSYKFELTRKT